MVIKDPNDRTKRKVSMTAEERAAFIDSILKKIEDEDDSYGAVTFQEKRRMKEERKAMEEQSAEADRSERPRRAPQRTERAASERPTGTRKAAQSAEADRSERPRRAPQRTERAAAERPAGTRRPSQQPVGDGSSRPPRTSQTSGKKRKKKKTNVFWICLAIYAAILLVCSFYFLRYTDKCLTKYENSQSEKAMDDIVALFKKSAENGKLKDQITLDDAVSGVFEDVSVYKDIYLNSFKGAKNYTFRKSENSYMTESPIYDILADDQHVAQITLKATNERTIFGILTVVDWEVDKVEPVLTVGANDYTIIVDQTYEVYLNGIQVTEEFQKGDPVMNPEYENFLEYVQMPATVTYKVKGLVNTPKLVVKNAKGEEEELTFDENHTATKVMEPVAQEMPQELEDMAYDAGKMWEDFVTGDLKGDQHGFSQMKKYLIKDSFYYESAKKYASSVDITLISDHVILDPKWTHKLIENYIPFGDNCFSVHMSYVKNMKLIRGGRIIEDKIDATFYFVKYDDTDDGEDNPHWAIVDMIPVTKNDK